MDLHPDKAGGPITNDGTTTGLNNNEGTFPENALIRCKKCGYAMNKTRHPKGWGEGNTQASTQLNGAVSAAATTITVDSTTGFATPKTGSITAFASYRGGKNTQVTATAHGLKGGVVTISATTNYNGTFNIIEWLTNTFVIAKPYVADDATGTWTVPEHIYIHDTGTYATVESSTTHYDVSSTYTAATGGPRIDKVSYTGLTSTTFTGCSGALAHDDNMYVRAERKASGGCAFCGTYEYD
jgi:hypothetical protein